jgi:hypothetical protein
VHHQEGLEKILKEEILFVDVEKNIFHILLYTHTSRQSMMVVSLKELKKLVPQSSQKENQKFKTSFLSKFKIY